MEGVLRNPVLARWPLSSPQAASVLCYPPREGCDPDRVASQVEAAGVCCLLDLGRAELSLGGVEVRVLGKGHSSVVFAGQLNEGYVVAVKVRRTDSKRGSLEHEGRLLEEAARAGASPRPLYYSRDVIVMQYVGDVSLERLLRDPPPQFVAVAMVEALRAARALDSALVLHEELHRPLQNVFYPWWPESPRALVIDLESASRGCGNVNKFVSFLLGRELMRGAGVLKGLLREYREAKCPRDAYLRVEEAVRAFLGL